MVKKFLRAVLVGVAALVCSVAVQAAYTVTINEVGADVVATGSGSFNLGALTPAGVGFMSPLVQADNAVVYIGAAANVDVYGTGAILAGPTNFGPGIQVMATNGAGPAVAFAPPAGLFGLPVGYVDGAPLAASSATWTGQSLGSLGITPGTYVWTWGAGPTADSFTIIAGAAPAAATSIPTLSEWGMVFLATLLGMLGFARMRRPKN